LKYEQEGESGLIKDSRRVDERESCGRNEIHFILGGGEKGHNFSRRFPEFTLYNF
jgi:hypothetical protein